MSIPLQYGYLLGDSIAAVMWLILFLLRKDVRKEMLVMGITLALASMVTAYLFWTHDWWHPATITGTRVGIEDLLLGFFYGGVMAVIYEMVFQKRHHRHDQNLHWRASACMLSGLFAGTWFLYSIGITSFAASTIVLMCNFLFLLVVRHDLLRDSILSGLLTVLAALPIYYAIILFVPGWVAATYDFNHLSGITVTGIPLEELVFWFVAGLTFGPFWEYWRGERLYSIRKSARKSHRLAR